MKYPHSCQDYWPGPCPAGSHRQPAATYYSGTTDSNGTHCCSNCGRTLAAHETRGKTVGDSRYRQGFLVCPTDY